MESRGEVERREEKRGEEMQLEELLPVVDFLSMGITVAFRLAPRSSSQKVSKGSRRYVFATSYITCIALCNVSYR